MGRAISLAFAGDGGPAGREDQPQFDRAPPQEEEEEEEIGVRARVT